jgi:predicted O-methyltransferase YrrM
MTTRTAAELLSVSDIKAEFPAALSAMLDTGQAVGRTRKVPFVGGSTVNNLYVLRNLYEAIRPARTLEVGLACGASALLLTSLHRKHAPDAKGQHTAIDPFQADLDDAGLHQIACDGLAPYFRHLREPSLSALPRLLAEGERFQLIYVDGSHLYEDVFIDAFYGTRLLDRGGVIAFDDSTWPDVAKVIRFFERNFAGRLERLDVLDYRPPETVNAKTRIAYRLGRNQITAFRLIDDPVRPWSAKMVDF